MSDKRIHLGQQGEKLAVQYLKKKGYKILGRNYRKRFGEIDIIAKDGTFLVFVEVKTRTTTTKGSPHSSVTFKKQQQISRVALEYLSSKNLLNHDARFDVISILIETKDDPHIELLQNAFELSYGL